jgi:hypothetical protein
MQFLTSILLLTTAALSSAAPTTEKRDSFAIAPSSLVRTYEASPNFAAGPSAWGETSRIGAGNTGVNTLISFQLDASHGGRPCNLRFRDAEWHEGSNTFSVFSFVPTNGYSFDVNTASWNHKTGYRDQQLATYKYGGSTGDLVYSFTCPSDGKLLNYELTSANGESKLQWDTSIGQGLWLEVVTASAAVKRSSVPIPFADQCQLLEAQPNTARGSIQYGEVSQKGSGHIVSMLVAFIMPTNQDLTSRTCSLQFKNPSEATGSKTFALFEFVPNPGNYRGIFESWHASWNSRTGYRNRHLATYKVGTAGPVYKFPCPARGKGVNFEVVPSNGDVSIKWISDNGGFSLVAL